MLRCNDAANLVHENEEACLAAAGPGLQQTIRKRRETVPYLARSLFCFVGAGSVSFITHVNPAAMNIALKSNLLSGLIYFQNILLTLFPPGIAKQPAIEGKKMIEAILSHTIKPEGPASTLTFLGIELDSVREYSRLPEIKLEK